MVVTEGIFSMDGDSAPLAEIARIADETGALLLVDDAHGAGAVGDAGRGSCAMQHIRPDILVITFGKAFGVSGAAVLCSTRLGDYFLQFARHLIYSTAMPPAQAEAISAALAIVRSDEGNTLRALLQARIEHFRAGAAPLAWRLSPSVSAIQPLIVGDNHRTLALSDALRKKGVWTVPIRPPTVQSGSARLRITLSAAHTPADINMLLEALHACSR